MSNDLDTDIWDNDIHDTDENWDIDPFQSEDVEDDEYEELYEDEELSADALEEIEEFFEEEKSIVDSAKIRLQQGSLYEMLIGHNLFEGVDAHPEAIAQVEKELKGFILERLEVLLGMKAEKEKEVHKIVQESQFNDMEVQALKMIASKVTKGASATAPTTPSEKQLNTVKPKKQKLNSLSKPVKKVAKPAKKVVKKPKVASKPLPKKGSGVKKKIKKEIANTSTDGMSANEIAKKDIKYIESLKNMSLSQANEVVAQRHKRPVPKNIEINQDAVNGYYQQKVAVNNSKLGDYAKVLQQVALQKANEK
jgi:hypothetical protein